MAEKFSLDTLSPADQKRLAYIEGRPDLFETKVLRVQPVADQAPAESEGNLLVATRDPGSGNALMPVLKELEHDRRLTINIMTDGRAEEIIKGNFTTEDITPDTALAADQVVGKPDVMLLDRSNETGIESYAVATFSEVPKVLVEDYYGNTIGFLKNLAERGLPFPEKICVMDAEAKAIILKEFPDIEQSIEITGQPAFDRFVDEDTEKITRELKDTLGLKITDKLVTYMSTMDELEKIKQIAEALSHVDKEFYLIFRRHPRDNVSYEEYEKIFTDAGVKLIDTNEHATNIVGAASDVILTTASTEGLHGIYRGKPTAHITPKEFKTPPILPLPPVKLGASVGVQDISELTKVVSELLDPDSDTNEKLREKMEQYYPADGKNAERVANVVREYLPKE